MYIVYINTNGGNRMEVAREDGNMFLTGAENAQNILATHRKNYRSNVTVTICTKEFGESVASGKGTKGW